jgi:ubiquinone/menaquinone biosynthesis C-methylase UbiE
VLDRISVAAARRVMRLAAAEPSENDLTLFEVFHTDTYLNGSPRNRERLQLASAQLRYDEERKQNFFATFFPDFDPRQLEGSTLLDLGCFTGGRLVAWAEMFGIADPVGIDISPIFAEAGEKFAQSRGINARFLVGYGERLPLESGTVDIIASYDVLEHVQDVARTLSECHRVLKPGGLLLAAFPPYFHPSETHLGFVSRVPALQWFFSGRTLTRALYEITEARGDRASWYSRSSPEPATWERSPTLNGVTVRRFRQIIRRHGPWKVLHWGTRPVFSGRQSRGGLFAMATRILALPARLPVLEEFTLARISCILRKESDA